VPPFAADVSPMLSAMLHTVTGMIGRGAAVMDRFVDRVIRASGAIRVMSGTAPWYPCS